MKVCSTSFRVLTGLLFLVRAGVWTRAVVWLPVWIFFGCALCSVLAILAAFSCDLASLPWENTHGECLLVL